MVLAESQDAQRPLLIVVRRRGRDLDRNRIDFMKDKVVSWWLPDDVYKLTLRERFKGYTPPANTHVRTTG